MLDGSRKRGMLNDQVTQKKDKTIMRNHLNILIKRKTNEKHKACLENRRFDWTNLEIFMRKNSNIKVPVQHIPIKAIEQVHLFNVLKAHGLLKLFGVEEKLPVDLFN